MICLLFALLTWSLSEVRVRTTETHRRFKWDTSVFHVTGEGSSLVRLREVSGGQNNPPSLSLTHTHAWMLTHNPHSMLGEAQPGLTANQQLLWWISDQQRWIINDMFYYNVTSVFYFFISPGFRIELIRQRATRLQLYVITMCHHPKYVAVRCEMAPRRMMGFFLCLSGIQNLQVPPGRIHSCL